MNPKRGNIMSKLNQLWIRYVTPRNAKTVYILLALAALAVAGGAPGGGGGMPGGGVSCRYIFF
jgi:hypothetical protein